jgi:hypothetical protein
MALAWQATSQKAGEVAHPQLIDVSVERQDNIPTQMGPTRLFLTSIAEDPREVMI